MQIIIVEYGTKKHVKDYDVQTPQQVNDLHPMCANADVMVLPQYNKPKKITMFRSCRMVSTRQFWYLIVRILAINFLSP